MTIKIIGAICILAGCGVMGFRIAAEHRKEVAILRDIAKSIQYMICELQYQMTPLPELCVRTAGQACGVVERIFRQLSRELDSQVSPDVYRCMNAAIEKTSALTKQSKVILQMLGQGLGRFNLSGQIKSLESVGKECNRVLEETTKDQTVRLRNYQTLGICAGAALVILFI